MHGTKQSATDEDDKASKLDEGQKAMVQMMMQGDGRDDDAKVAFRVMFVVQGGR